MKRGAGTARFGKRKQYSTCELEEGTSKEYELNVKVSNTHKSHSASPIVQKLKVVVSAPFNNRIGAKARSSLRNMLKLEEAYLFLWPR